MNIELEAGGRIVISADPFPEWASRLKGLGNRCFYCKKSAVQLSRTKRGPWKCEECKYSIIRKVFAPLWWIALHLAKWHWNLTNDIFKI